MEGEGAVDTARQSRVMTQSNSYGVVKGKVEEDSSGEGLGGDRVVGGAKETV